MKNLADRVAGAGDGGRPCRAIAAPFRVEGKSIRVIADMLSSC